MMSIIFANFWTWAGAVILLAVALGGVADCIKAARRPKEPERKIKTYDFGNGTTTVEIECATEDDLRRIVEDFRRPVPYIVDIPNGKSREEDQA